MLESASTHNVKLFHSSANGLSTQYSQVPKPSSLCSKDTNTKSRLTMARFSAGKKQEIEGGRDPENIEVSLLFNTAVPLSLYCPCTQCSIWLCLFSLIAQKTHSHFFSCGEGLWLRTRTALRYQVLFCTATSHSTVIPKKRRTRSPDKYRENTFFVCRSK